MDERTMNMRDWALWWRAAGIRAVKTAAQAALGTFTLGVAVADIDWLQVGGIALTSAVYSLFTSLAGLPEERMTVPADGPDSGTGGTA